jgi:hypothetical protein
MYKQVGPSKSSRHSMKTKFPVRYMLAKRLRTRGRAC